jgi:hypothetical protein
MTINNLPDNMLSKISVTDCAVKGLEGMCWTWTGCLNSKGYGCVGVGNKKTALTHRVSYELHIGPIPPGLQIDHLCRNTKCCNPHHLEPVTCRDNIRRAHAATKVRCKSGHPLAGPNLRIKSKGKAGTQRQCRVCEIDTARRQSERRGVREQSAAAVKREAKQTWLIAAGDAALAGEPIPAEPSYGGTVLSMESKRTVPVSNEFLTDGGLFGEAS